MKLKVPKKVKPLLPEEVFRQIKGLPEEQKQLLVKKLDKVYKRRDEYEKYIKENTKSDRFKYGKKLYDEEAKDLKKEILEAQDRIQMKVLPGEMEDLGTLMYLNKKIEGGQKLTSDEMATFKRVASTVKKLDTSLEDYLQKSGLSKIEAEEITEAYVAVKAGISTETKIAGKDVTDTKIVSRKLPDEYIGYDALIKIHGMIGEVAPEAKGITGFISKAVSKTNKAFVDRFAPIAKASKVAYEEARVTSSAKEVADIKFNELIEVFKPVRGERDLLEKYITAHRAKERAARGLTNPNNVTYADAVQAIKEAEKIWVGKGRDVQTLRKVIKGWNAWTDKYILREALDNGFISKAVYNNIQKNNENYAAYSVF